MAVRVVLLAVAFAASIGIGCAADSPNASPVALDFFVMSQCPDAQACESWYAKALSQIEPIIDSDISYIASEKPPGSGKFSCPHGRAECDGDRQQLCVKYATKNAVNPATNRTYLYDFALCQSNDADRIPKNGAECAQSVGLDWQPILQCFNDKTVSDPLFRNSIAKTNAAKIDTCCTVSVNQKVFCVHDGNWKQCPHGHQPQDLINFVCKTYSGSDKPPACS